MQNQNGDGADWDPMREEFEDSEKNCYEHGPGVNLDLHLQRPAYRDRNNKAVYKLFVTNISPRLSQVGLENLFLHYGKPTHVHKIQKNANGKGSFAFVEYQSLEEAQNAISGLDQRAPLNMTVTFARSDATKEKMKRQKAWEEEARKAPSEPCTESCVNSTAIQSDQLYRSPLLRNTGIGRGRLLVKAFLSSNSRHCTWSEGESDLRNPQDFLPDQNKFDSSNKVLQNLVVMTSDGARKVAMGRAYIPPLHITQNDSQRSFTLQSQGVYQEGEDIVLPSQKCSVCNVYTVLKCCQCGEPYCSRKCQEQDYPTHKSKCFPKMSIDITMDNRTSERSVKLSTLTQNMDTMDHLFPTTDQKKASLWGRPENHAIDFIADQKSICLRVTSKSYPNFIGMLGCSSILDETEKLVVEMPEYFLNKAHDASYRPGEGALVAVNYLRSFWRGFVLSAECFGTDRSYQVALCDIGKIVTVPFQSIHRLPVQFHQLPEMTVKCTVLQSYLPGEVSELWNIICEDKDYELKVKDDNFTVIADMKLKENPGAEEKTICEIAMVPWEPILRQRDITVTPLESSCHVVISAYHDQHAIYVRRIGKSFQEDFFKILQQVAAVHVTAPPLGRPPRKGEMVACQYEKDKNFYRGVVCDISDKSREEYLVFFIDFGNVESVKASDMKALPDCLKTLPSMAVKVSLKDVPAEPLTEEAILFLNNLMIKERELVLEFHGETWSEGVELFLQKASVNAELNTLLMPEWKRAMKEGQEPYRGLVYMLEDITVLPLFLDGSTTGRVRVLVLNILADGRLCVCPVDRPETEHVAKTLSHQINEYCETFDPSFTYCPRDNEVCLAKFTDGLWYRAVSLRSTSSRSCEVMFLDYGDVGVIEVGNIRRMVGDFTHTPCLVSFCAVDGFPENPSSDMTERVSQLVRFHEVYDVEVLIKYQDGDFKIHIPEVSNQLLSEVRHKVSNQ